MSNPLILYENILEDGTLTVTESEAAGFPIANVLDWRMGTAYRWKSSNSTTVYIDLDLGGSTADADTIVIGGHNLGTADANVQVAGDSFTPPTSYITVKSPFTDDLPLIKTFTAPGVKRYWRIAISSLLTAPQIGIITLGRRIDYSAGALFDLDPYHRASNVEPYINNNGSPIGVNVRSKTKRFNMSYGGSDPGMLATEFFTTITPSFDDFLDHGVDSAKPFWFNWNYAVDPTEVYLCRIDGPEVSMPFVGSTLRRGLQCSFIAHRETS